MKLSRTFSLLILGIAVLLLAADGPNSGPPDTVRQADNERPAVPPVALVTVPFPLTGMADSQFMSSVDKVLKDLPPSETRPIVVFEFRVPDDEAGRRSDFGRAFAVARYLAGNRFSRVRTVAFVPTTLEGHSVLPVLACEEIIIAPDAQLGAAGRDESSIGPTMRAAYREIAERRRTVPVPLVYGMLDPDVTVTEVQLVGGGKRYVTQDELDELRKDAKIAAENTVVGAGDLAAFSGRQLRIKYGFASQMAANRKELANVLQIPPDVIRDETAVAGGWKALRIDIRGRISSRTVDDVTHAIRDVQRKENANLVCLRIDSPGGQPASALRLINTLTSLDSNQVRTIGFIEGRALSVAALVALACDETYAAEDSQLGGPGDTFIDRNEVEDLRESIREFARNEERDWSLLAGLVDPELQVNQCRREGTGTVRYLCDEERDEQAAPDQWIREGQLELSDGITGIDAKKYGLVRGTAESLDEALGEYRIDDEIAVAERNPVISAIENLAAQPWLARTLLFIAFFALISEASAPGVGIAGFASGVCFLLFFWCQFLNGTAGWLELVLFIGGLTCIGLEIFVIPGFGIFGIGGGVMVLASIVLASQTFIFPRNSYQFEQLPSSFFTMVVACGGVMTSMWIMRRFLAESRVFGRLMLTPPAEDEDLDELEAMVDWGYLEGKRGVTTTQLTPSGKARFGDDVVNVISDGKLVPKGTAIYVAMVRGNCVRVEPLDES